VSNTYIAAFQAKTRALTMTTTRLRSINSPAPPIGNSRAYHWDATKTKRGEGLHSRVGTAYVVRDVGTSGSATRIAACLWNRDERITLDQPGNLSLVARLEPSPCPGRERRHLGHIFDFQPCRPEKRQTQSRTRPGARTASRPAGQTITHDAKATTTSNPRSTPCLAPSQTSPPLCFSGI